jgi:VMA21-like domain
VEQPLGTTRELRTMPTAFEVFFGPENRAVTMKLLWYSLAMLVAPLVVFYFFLHVVFESNVDMIGWCGIAAVVAANIVIASYVVMAWNEPDPEADKERARRAALPAKAYRVD